MGSCIQSPEHSRESAEGRGLPAYTGGSKDPSTTTGKHSHLPAAGANPKKLELQMPNKDIFQAISSAPQNHLHADTHYAYTLAPAPLREGCVGSGPALLPAPSRRLVWCPCSLLLSGLQAQSTHVCIPVHVCTHIHVNMILWRAESSRKSSCSELISATFILVSIWATQLPISQGPVRLV